MQIQEIFDHLFAGKRLQLSFDNKNEYESFRVRLFQLKARQEQQMIDLGMMEPGDKMALSFAKQEDDLLGAGVTVEVSLKAKQLKKEFKVVILE